MSAGAGGSGSGQPASDVWAVGAQTGANDAHADRALRGTAWSVVSAPSPDASAQLSAVTADLRHEVWAAGTSVLPSQASRSLLEDWSCTLWWSTGMARPGASRSRAASEASRAWLWCRRRCVGRGVARRRHDREPVRRLPLLARPHA